MVFTKHTITPSSLAEATVVVQVTLDSITTPLALDTRFHSRRRVPLEKSTHMMKQDKCRVGAVDSSTSRDLKESSRVPDDLWSRLADKRVSGRRRTPQEHVKGRAQKYLLMEVCKGPFWTRQVGSVMHVLVLYMEG